MDRWGAVLAVVLVAGVLVAGCGGSGDDGTTDGAEALPSAQLPPHKRAKLNTAARQGVHDAATPGAVVGVQTATGRWVKAFGIADRHREAAMSVDVHHRIGSVTKTFTATLLMQLVGEGKLSLDDRIGQYVKGVPEGNRITLRQVADMTSGVASYTQDPAFMKAVYGHPERKWSPNRLLKIGLDDSPEFKPGRGFEYSNTNYVLLGMVIEQVEGKPIGEVLRDRIIEPLGLSQTSWPGGSAALPSPHAEGYTLQGQSSNTPVNATAWSPTPEWTAGELISMADDLLVYGHALGTGEGLLPPREQKERLASFNTRPPPLSRKLSYGIGLVNDKGWLGHTGEVPGFTTTVYYSPALETTVVVEANSDIGSGSCRGQETLSDDPIRRPCAAPADRIMAAIAHALGREYRLPLD